VIGNIKSLSIEIEQKYDRSDTSGGVIKISANPIYQHGYLFGIIIRVVPVFVYTSSDYRDLFPESASVHSNNGVRETRPSEKHSDHTRSHFNRSPGSTNDKMDSFDHRGVWWTGAVQYICSRYP
jgi:hypothetical protein